MENDFNDDNSKSVDSKDSEDNNQSISFIVKKNKDYITSLKIYKCVFYYIKFNQWLSSNLMSKSPLKYNLFLIDKKWLNDFLSSCNYNQIITKVKNEKIEIKDDYQIFANYFAKNYPLSPEILDNKPKEAEKKFNNYEYYYDEYNFIDEKTLNIFFH